jgi:hypothetical protein
VAGARNLLVIRARNASCQGARQRRRRGLIQGAAQHQSGVLDLFGARAEIEGSQREAGARKALRVDGGERRFAGSDDLRMLLGELGGKHAPDRGIEDGLHARLGYPLRHGAERGARRFWEHRQRIGHHQAAKPRAVPDRELERHEGAEAVAKDISVARQLECAHHAGDMIGVCAY